MKNISKLLNSRSSGTSIAFMLALIVSMLFFSAFAYSIESFSDNANNVAVANTRSTVGTSGVPAKIVVTCAPPKVLADNGYYDQAVRVELQDLYGNPAYAPAGSVGVSVSSSDPTIGSTSSYTYIAAGKTFATLNFHSTYNPGQTTITATASGMVPGSAVMTTVGVQPYKVKVILAPNKVLADDETYSNLVCVQLQDSSGNPAMAPNEISVSLASSNTSIGTVPTSLTIYAGETFEAVSFKSTLVSGTTQIKAAAAGLVGASATMTTVAPGVDPATKFVVWLAPSKLLADGSTKYYPVVVGLQDASGKPVEAQPGGVTASLVSSNTTVGIVTGALTISAGYEFGYTSFTSTYVPGKTTIRATAVGLTQGSAIMTTIGYSPTKVAVYVAPSKVFAHRQYSYYSIAVQAQDASGNPARAPAGGITAALTSSSPTIGTVPASVTISAGQTHETAYFYSTYKPGQTTITATVGPISGSAVMKTTAPNPAKLGMNLALSKVLAIAGKYYYIVRVLLLDSAGNPSLAPAGGVAVTLTSSEPGCGTVQSPITIYEGDFFAEAWFSSTAAAGATNITATATIGGIIKTVYKTLTTILPTTNPPTALKVVPLPKMPSIAQTYYYPVVVYLVDSAGNPAKAPSSTSISLSSSDSLVGTVPASLTIPTGDIYQRTWFTSTWCPGTTTITAAAVDLTSGTATITTGVFTPVSKVYQFANIPYLFYTNTFLVVGNASTANDTMSAAIFEPSLIRAGATSPTVKTDILLTATEKTSGNLIAFSYYNTIRTSYPLGIVINADEAWFNITATTEGKSINFTRSDYPSKSVAIVYLAKQGTRAIMFLWGYGWQGTYAAALFMSNTANWQTYATKHLLFLQWEDTNTNGFIEKTEITVASSA